MRAMLAVEPGRKSGVKNSNSSAKLSEQSSVSRGEAVSKLLECRNIARQIEQAELREDLLARLAPIIVTVLRDAFETWRLSDEARARIAQIVEEDLNDRTA